MLRKKGSKNKRKVKDYKLILKSLGRFFKSEGKTLDEALGGIKISGGAKGISVLTVVKGDRTKEIILNSGHTMVFGEVGPTMKMIKFKQISERIGL